MEAHSSIIAWRIPSTEEFGGLQSMGSQRVGHNGSDLAHTKVKKTQSEGGGRGDRDGEDM